MSPLPAPDAAAALQALRYAAAQLGFSAAGVAPADADQGDRLPR